ncbi:6206_t:CDS:2 [Scutellospora calospora]|uniref:6206_t:CDS:1 n=1 Tax=Scutellospora calospora TaxID=85575 RepID=A0ACA9KAR0_9GLOM|nr:6206_t:CDS:2 [Scutellospora calospora]
MLNTERAIVHVLVIHFTIMRRKILDRPGDEGKDIICQITRITIVIQCKNYTCQDKIDNLIIVFILHNVIIFAHETVVQRYTRKKRCIAYGIVVAPFMNAFSYATNQR